MRKQAIVATLALGLGLVFGGGCQKRQDAYSSNTKKKRDLRAQSEGRLEVDQSATLPVDVRAGVQREYPGSTVQNVTLKRLDDRQVRYQVDLTTKDGKRVTREFDDKGKAASQG